MDATRAPHSVEKPCFVLLPLRRDGSYKLSVALLIQSAKGLDPIEMEGRHFDNKWIAFVLFFIQNCNRFTSVQFDVYDFEPLRLFTVRSFKLNGILENFSSPLYDPWNDGWFCQQPNPKDAKFCPMNQTKRSYHLTTKLRRWWSASDRTNAFVGYHSWCRHESISIRSMSCLCKW